MGTRFGAAASQLKWSQKSPHSEYCSIQLEHFIPAGCSEAPRSREMVGRAC
jgi:hypothetical protein